MLFLASFCLLWDSFSLLAAFFSRLLKKTQQFLNNLIILVKVQNRQNKNEINTSCRLGTQPCLCMYGGGPIGATCFYEKKRSSIKCTNYNSEKKDKTITRFFPSTLS